jgi:hypothetical protein
MILLVVLLQLRLEGLERGRVQSSPFRGLAIAIKICKKFCLQPNTKTKTDLKRKTKTRRANVKHLSKK